MKSVIRFVCSSAILCSTVACAAPDHSGSDGESVATAKQPVVNGRLGVDSDLLGTVALMFDGSVGCSGTLVAEQIVVTAAHCVKVDPDDPNSADIPATTLSIVAGMLDVNQATPSDRYAVAKIQSHENYPADDLPEPYGLGQDDDIAVLVLEQPVTEIAPIPILPEAALSEALSDGTMVTVTGYGIYDLSVDAIGVLYTGATPFLGRSNFEIHAGGMGNADSCSGDSGGPLYVDFNGSTYVVGATSRAAMNAVAYCGESGIYTAVSAYTDWIDQQANDMSVTPPAPTDPDPGNDDGAGGSTASDPGEPNSGTDEKEASVGGATASAEGGCSASGTAPASPWGWASILLGAAMWLRRKEA